MKILITGAAGFIGYHLAKHLLEGSGNELTLIDNLQRGNMDEEFTTLISNKKIKFVKADLTDEKNFNTLDVNFDHVYHLAAVNGTKLFYQIPEEVLRINTLSLIHLLEWIKTLAKKPKLCFTSSNEAYAGALASFNQLPIPTPENVPLVVSDTYNPRWSYGGSKLIGELFTIHYAKAYNFPAVIVRPHNIYGPRAGYDHVIPELFQKIIAQTDPFTLFSPKETRTFCYVDDFVRAMKMLMKSSLTSSQPAETVHIGNTEEITMLNLAKEMFKISNWKPKNMDFRPSPAGSVKRRCADISKIKRLIGWKPKISLKAGLKLTLEWYAKHPKK